MQTVDIEIDEFGFEGQPPFEAGFQRYIRIEIFPGVVKHANSIRNEDWQGKHKYQIIGRLQWDADGFLEIHPTCDKDVRKID